MTNTIATRWNAALDSIKFEHGVTHKMNVEKCCRGCVLPGDIGIKTEEQDAIWTYGNQGFGFYFSSGEMFRLDDDYPDEDEGEDDDYILDWDDEEDNSFDLDGPFLRTKERVEEVAVYHTTNYAASVAVQAFRDQGFEVKWEGNYYNAVMVTIN